MGKVIDKGSLRPGDGIPLGGPMIVSVPRLKRSTPSTESGRPTEKPEKPQKVLPINNKPTKP